MKYRPRYAIPSENGNELNSAAISNSRKSIISTPLYRRVRNLDYVMVTDQLIFELKLHWPHQKKNRIEK